MNDLHTYHCSPGVLVEMIQAPHASAAAIEYMRRKPLSHGQVMSLTVSRAKDDGSPDPDGSIYYDPQECIRMSIAATGMKEWSYRDQLD